jgi:hypothetical protein
MLLFELTNRIEKAKYLEDDERQELLSELPELNDEQLEELNNIFIDVDNEYEILTQASDFALTGFMEALSAMNNLELKVQKNAREI